MNLFQAFILSIVEGITEFLPISSTGHLILTSHLLGIPQTAFTKSFEIVIQFGAILAVVWLYRKQMLDIRYWIQVMSAFIPTAVVGLVLYGFIKDYLIGNVMVTLAALFLGGIAIIIFDHILRPTATLNIRRAIGIGLIQSLSIVPGVSRAAATIIGGRMLGLSREEAVKFSFFLAIPTITGASVLDLANTGIGFSSSEWSLLAAGIIGSFITALISIKLLVRYVQKHSFLAFGVYRVILALVYYSLLY